MMPARRPERFAWTSGGGAVEDSGVDLSLSGILASFVVSSAGCVLFRYGRKSVRTPQLVSGLALMIFPAFVSGAVLSLSIGAAILALLWLGLRAGL